MALSTETAHRGGFLISEAPGTGSRENVTILSGQDLEDGTVVTGDMTAGTITGAARSGNTGNGTIGTLSVGVKAQRGIYAAVIIEPGSNAGTFEVFDPAGVSIGKGTVGSEFSGEIVFTISDGGTDFVAGDGFDIKVTSPTMKYRALPNDGSKDAEGILYGNVDASAADTAGVIIARNAEANGNEVVWPSGISTPDKQVAIERLATRGIAIRS